MRTSQTFILRCCLPAFRPLAFFLVACIDFFVGFVASSGVTSLRGVTTCFGGFCFDSSATCALSVAS